MALERLQPSFSTFSIYLRLSMIESPLEMSNIQKYRRIAPVCSIFSIILGLENGGQRRGTMTFFFRNYCGQLLAPKGSISQLLRTTTNTIAQLAPVSQ